MLTHAARAAAKQPPLVAARGAREGLWLEQARSSVFHCKLKLCLIFLKLIIFKRDVRTLHLWTPGFVVEKSRAAR